MSEDIQYISDQQLITISMLQLTFPGLKSAKFAKASAELFPALFLVPELINGSFDPNGSASNPLKGFTFSFGDTAMDPNGRGLFDLGGAGRGGGAFLFLARALDLAEEVKGSIAELEGIWK